MPRFSQPLPLKIEGLGRYLPERVVSNEELETRCNLKPGWIAKRTGVLARRWADPKRETHAFMGARAAEEALEHAATKLSDIDLILNASGTQQHVIPENAPFLQAELGDAAKGIAAFSVNATCLSFISALDVAASFLATGRYERILLVSADMASVGLNFEEPESAVLFGDAAAAVVLSRGGDSAESVLTAAHFATYSEGANLTGIHSGAAFAPAYTYKPENHADFLFSMEGRKVLRLARRHMPDFLETLQPGLATSLDGIDLVVPHQASRMGLKMSEGLDWAEDKMVQTLSFLGNTIAASIPVTLYEAFKQGRLERGQRVLLIGTGAGLSIGGLILRY